MINYCYGCPSYSFSLVFPIGLMLLGPEWWAFLLPLDMLSQSSRCLSAGLQDSSQLDYNKYSSPPLLFMKFLHSIQRILLNFSLLSCSWSRIWISFLALRPLVEDWLSIDQLLQGLVPKVKVSWQTMSLIPESLLHPSLLFVELKTWHLLFAHRGVLSD